MNMTFNEHYECLMTAPHEHDYFEDVRDASISEDTLINLNDMYNAILRSYDRNEDELFKNHSELLTFAVPKKDCNGLKLTMRRAYHCAVWRLFKYACSNRALNDKISELTNKYLQGVANGLLSESGVARVTLEKFNNPLDDYDINEHSIEWIINNMFNNF